MNIKAFFSNGSHNPRPPISDNPADAQISKNGPPRTSSLTINVWDDTAIKLPPPEVKSPIYQKLLLLENCHPKTSSEEKFYAEIEEDSSTVQFKPDNLTRVIIEDSPVPLPTPVSDETRFIERLNAQSKTALASYGFVVAVNPTSPIGSAIRSSTSSISLITVVTTDYYGDVDSSSLLEADCVVIPTTYEESIYIKNAPKAIRYSSDSEALKAFKSGIVDLSPKEFNVLLPVMNCAERLPEFQKVDTSCTDVVLWLDCAEDEAPVVSSTFMAFLEELTPRIVRLAVTDEIRRRYIDLLERTDDPIALSRFLFLVCRNSARVEFRYA